jgi:hypothetical protein
MSYKIFISFDAEDRAVADSLKLQLSKAGAEVSTTQEVPEGVQIKLRISDAMRMSDEVIAIVSKRSVHSQWLSFEVGMAAGLGKKLLPVVVGISPSELPPVLKSFRAVKLNQFPDYVAGLSKKNLGL